MEDPIALLNSSNSIPEAFDKIGQALQSAEVYRQADFKSAHWLSRNYNEVRARVAKIASYLKSVGVTRGTRVAIVSSSRPEWLEADMAILSLGGVSVAVYQSLPPEEMGYILFDSEAKVVFAENREQVEKLKVLLSSPCKIPGTEEREPQTVQLRFSKIIAFDAVEADPLIKVMNEILETPEIPNFEYDASLSQSDLANLVYTSGTTGPPKGVMQTHGNHLANCRQAYEGEMVNQSTSLMLVLPLAHSFAKLMGYLGMLTPTRLAFSAVADRSSSRMNPKIVSRDMAAANANIYPLVPRLLEKISEGIREKAEPRKLLKLALWSATKRYNAIHHGETPSPLVSAAFRLTGSIRRIVKRKLFGPNFVACISGGAKLSPEVGRFFDALGIEVLEGYGLTETCVATNCNRLGRKRFGTVGPKLAHDVEVRIAEDGEILFRGPNVTNGYLNRAVATKSSWDTENWFHTGDLGSVDKDGYLSIVGRKKELIVTSYGKKIAPVEIEHKLSASPYISHVVLAGDGKQYIGALITLIPGSVREWAKSAGKKLGETLSKEEAVRGLIGEEIEKVNSTLASFEQIKKFVLVDEDFSIENGILTPTLKVKRKVVLDRYRDEIEALF